MVEESNDPNISWDDWVGDTDNLRIAVKDIMNRQNTNVITQDSTITLETKIKNTEITIEELEKLVKQYSYDFKSLSKYHKKFK